MRKTVERREEDKTKRERKTERERKIERERKTEREVVLDLLHAVFTEGVFLHLALQRAFSAYPYFDGSKRALITRLSHGTVERYIQLDDCISRYSNTPLKKIKPRVLEALRLSAYQLLFMDKIPPHAAINESLKYLKKRKLQGLVPFANAVLRRISENKEGLLTILSNQHKEDAIGAALPEEIFSYLKEEYGLEETMRMARAFLQTDSGFYIRNEQGEGALLIRRSECTGFFFAGSSEGGSPSEGSESTGLLQCSRRESLPYRGTFRRKRNCLCTG